MYDEKNDAFLFDETNLRQQCSPKKTFMLASMNLGVFVQSRLRDYLRGLRRSTEGCTSVFLDKLETESSV